MNLFKVFLRLFLFGIIINTGCRKDAITTDKGAKLRFSTDTVYFDTILTTFGSVTNRFKIYNPNNEDIKIDELYLGGGVSSYYHLNVDGVKGDSHKNIEIKRKDSIYVFVNVTLDPLNSNNPMVVTDSIVCLTNGNHQTVKLVSFGQDVNLFRSKVIKSQKWTAGKPYLIYNNVALDTGEVLTIEPGTRIFLNYNSSLLIFGSLQAQGTFELPIVFSGDRFDSWYENAAGQWGTIYFDSQSKNNLMKYVTVKNANAGIQVGHPSNNEGPSVELDNCMILNSASAAIFAFNAKINAFNTILADCGQEMLFLAMGGNYNFYHLTASNISAYYPGSFNYTGRSTPSLIALNYYYWVKLNDNYELVNSFLTNNMDLNFYNSIFYGNLNSEIAFRDTAASGFNYKFDHCIIKNHKDSLDYNDINHFNKIILNKDPRFVNDSASLGKLDFQLDSLSPAIDSGSVDIINNPLFHSKLQNDYKGNQRDDGKPDLGAYERKE